MYILQNSGRQISDVIARAAEACSSDTSTSIWRFLFSIIITIRLDKDSERRLGVETSLLGNPRDMSKKALELENLSPYRSSVKEPVESSPILRTPKDM
jgi:hypothetical protein